MIKGFKDHKNTEWLVVPIIENTECEKDLTASLKNAIITYPRSSAVLVRNHGVYIWGPTWERTKIFAECYEYLFKAILKMHKYSLPIPKTDSAHSAIKAWFIDESKIQNEGLRVDLQYKYSKWVDPDYLKRFGVLHWKLDGDQNNSELNNICANYRNRDTVKIEPQMANFEEKIKKFAEEHLHADEEVRYVLDGSGYFDVRDGTDSWIRIHVTKGDLLILPEGIYHRFVLDISNYIYVMRLFKEEPQWTPINRPCDENPSRIKYLKEINTISSEDFKIFKN